MPASTHFSSRTVTSASSGASETSWGTSSSDYFWHYHWIPPHFMASNLFTELRLTHWWLNARQNCRIDLLLALPLWKHKYVISTRRRPSTLPLAHYCECETSRWFVDNFIRDQLHAGHPLHPGGAGLLLLLSVLAGDAAHYWLRHAADHHRVSLRGGPRLAPGR